MILQRTKIINYAWRSERNIWIKDESGCPTGTFKDRLAIKVMQLIKEKSSPKDWTISSITLGNTIISLAYMASRLFPIHERPGIFGIFPHDFSSRIIGPDNEGHSVTGEDVINRAKNLGAICIQKNLYNEFLTIDKIGHIAEENHFRSDRLIDVSQGLSKPSYLDILTESLEQTEGKISIIIVPVGAGILFDEFVNYIETNELNITVYGATTNNPFSIADKLFSYFSKYYAELSEFGMAASRRNARHRIFHVDDNEIRQTLESIPSCISTEPSAAASFCLLDRQGLLGKSDTVLVINTGNGIHVI